MSATRPLRRPLGRALLAASVAALLASTLTGCGSDAEASGDAEGQVTIANTATSLREDHPRRTRPEGHPGEGSRRRSSTRAKPGHRGRRPARRLPAAGLRR
ncbi:hypothetical protein [Nocardioides convexus]|uniref:hypothetical protein n=1 Tax=Nocardioides convexus TaxID=2712224 RepID=UPI00241816F7|nr:hypothetical protein [Nocardioides convexus]